MQHIWLARGANLALMMFEGELPGAADNFDVVAGAVGAYGIEQGAETRVDEHAGIRLGHPRYVRLRRRCTRGRHA
jgi:hypothetical protein